MGSPRQPSLTAALIVTDTLSIRHRRPAQRNGVQVFQVKQGGEEMERFQDQVQVA